MLQKKILISYIYRLPQKCVLWIAKQPFLSLLFYRFLLFQKIRFTCKRKMIRSSYEAMKGKMSEMHSVLSNTITQRQNKTFAIMI